MENERWGSVAGRRARDDEPLRIERPPLPEGTHWESVDLVGHAPEDVYLCARLVDARGQSPPSPYLVRFDGTAWTRLDAPAPSTTEWKPRCAATADGAVWFLLAGGERPALHRRTREGE